MRGKQMNEKVHGYMRDRNSNGPISLLSKCTAACMRYAYKTRMAQAQGEAAVAQGVSAELP